jgi:8-oxo-dGTP pyrophosphatase MutT (NUDIX family)
MMITFDRGTTRFNYRVIGVAIEHGRVLLARFDERDFWVFPGGRAELLETSIESVERELEEELGTPVRAGRLLWMVENFFTLDGYDFHEIGMYYRISLDESSPLNDPAAVLRFEDGGSSWLCQWIEVDSLDGIEIRPAFLNQALRDIPESPRHVIVREAQSRA